MANMPIDNINIKSIYNSRDDDNLVPRETLYNSMKYYAEDSKMFVDQIYNNQKSQTMEGFKKIDFKNTKNNIESQ